MQENTVDIEGWCLDGAGDAQPILGINLSVKWVNSVSACPSGFKGYTETGLQWPVRKARRHPRGVFHSKRDIQAEIFDGTSIYIVLDISPNTLMFII